VADSYGTFGGNFYLLLQSIRKAHESSGMGKGRVRSGSEKIREKIVKNEVPL
jgi:hypothetical protein